MPTTAFQRTICALLVAGSSIVWAQSTSRNEDALQSGPTGAWLAKAASSDAQWIAVLRVSGRHLVGAVSSCSTARPVEILGGRVEGATLSFTCASPEGDRTLTFTGRLVGDAIEFTWDKQVRSDGFAYPEDPIFGASSPRVFRASRMMNAPATVADIAAKALGPPAVSFDRILRSAETPADWMTYSGDLRGYRYGPLTQVTPANVNGLDIAWLHQTHIPGRSVATPLIVNGVLYTILPGAPWPSPRNGEVVAMNAATGRILWTFPITTPRGAAASGGGGRPARGLAILGDRLFLGTLDAHLIALDAFTGRQIWNTAVADFADPACRGASNCYVITHAPLIVKDKVIVGVGGSEGPIRGFIAAFDAESGREAWRFHTIPAPGEPGNDTWAGESWKTGGGGVWQIGTYDPEFNTTYWGIGNPFPVYDGTTRGGDNLYTNSLVALDADTGRLKWHYQFTPHDEWDWDAAQVPVLADIQWKGQPRKAILSANRNGLFYILDRATGHFLMGKPFVEVNWWSGFDAAGRPQRVSNQVVSETSPMRPGTATNWYPPAYSRQTGLFYVPAWERAAVKPGIALRGKSYSAVRAFDPSTGEKRWEFIANDARFESGVLATASDLLFVGTTGDNSSGTEAARLADGYLHALDARTGQSVWKIGLPGAIGPVVTYEVDGRQYVAVSAGNTFFAFALRAPK